MSEKKSVPSKDNSLKPTRRRFMKGAAATGALAAAPAFFPAKVLGLEGSVAPNDKIILGGIGIGNRGRTVLRWMLRQPDVYFVASCDPQVSRVKIIKEMVDQTNNNEDCKTYHNIHEFLAERTDVDAVLSTTGDRWHALAAILAMRAGKDVYSEKPSCMTIAEGQAVVDTSKRYGRVYQTGTQRLSGDQFVFCNESVRLGRLGKVHTVRAHIAPWDAAEMRHDWLPGQPEPPKSETDWDHWLGPCPWRPYHPDYCKGAWRGHYDFHTSCIGEWGAHTFPQCQDAIEMIDQAAMEYGYVNNVSGDHMVTKFSNGISMVLERDMDKKYWHGSCGVRYEGEEGWVATADGYEKVEASSPALLADFQKIVNEYAERTGRAVGDISEHARNFLDCVRSRKQTVANASAMHHTMSTVHAANICMWLKRDLKYDPFKQEFNDEEANRLRTRAQREPWIM